MATSAAAVGVADNVPQSCCCMLLELVVEAQKLENLRYREMRGQS